MCVFTYSCPYVCDALEIGLTVCRRVFFLWFITRFRDVLKFCSPSVSPLSLSHALSLSRALSLSLLACVNVLRGSVVDVDIDVAAIDCCNFCRFALFPFCVDAAEHNVRGLTPKRLNVSASPSHSRIQITQIHTCIYVYVSTCSFLCAHPASWRLTSLGLLILRYFIDKEPRACVCACALCVCVRTNSFHLYFALINCDLISNTRPSTAETRYQHRHAQHVVGASAIKIQNKSNGQCNHLATV